MVITANMSRKTLDNFVKTNLVAEVDPLECPFREFRDNELHADAWGLVDINFPTYNSFLS